MRAKAKLRAYAKINLGLKIVGRRADGYHELRTVFQTIGMHDRLEAEVLPGRGIRLEVTGETGGLGAEQENLAWRAAERARETLGIKGQIVMRLEKRIPAGAGLGGGSSDAAAVLRWLGERAGAGWERLWAMACELGADVPALLMGGTVLGVGRGDEVYALPELAKWHCVVAMPARACPTAAAYAAWDREHAVLTAAEEFDTIAKFCSRVEQMLPAFRRLGQSQARNRGAIVAPRVHAGIENDFQPGVFSLSPDFSRIHRALRQSQPAWVSLTGSGAAQFALFGSRAAAARCVAGLPAGTRSWSTKFVGR